MFKDIFDVGLLFGAYYIRGVIVNISTELESSISLTDIEGVCIYFKKNTFLFHFIKGLLNIFFYSYILYSPLLWGHIYKVVNSLVIGHL